MLTTCATLRAHLCDELLPLWERHGLDRAQGGYWSRLGRDLRPLPDGHKRLLVHARQVFAFTRGAELGAGPWARAAATHGLEFMVERFWDTRHGGWYTTTDDAGRPLDRRKDLYGHAFAVFALAHHYLFGRHKPGRTNIWEMFEKVRPMLPDDAENRGIGTPDQLRAHLQGFADAGVDQVVFIQQGGNNRHEDICSSLELFASRVQPGFKERHAASQAKKRAELAPYVEKAMATIPPLGESAPIEPVESYPVLMSRLGVDISQLPQQRNMGPAVQQIQQAMAGGRPTA